MQRFSVCSRHARQPFIHPHTASLLLDRSVPEKDEFGNVKVKIKWVREVAVPDVSSRLPRPFIIDLESTNGTHVNGEAIPTSRYYELRASDGPFSFTHPTRVQSFTSLPQ